MPQFIGQHEATPAETSARVRVVPSLQDILYWSEVNTASDRAQFRGFLEENVPRLSHPYETEAFSCRVRTKRAHARCGEGCVHMLG